MKMKNVLLFIILLIISSKSYATDQWRVFGAGSYDVKSKYDPPPFRKWHKTIIGYIISSAPSGLGYLIDRSFDTWEACGYLSFTSGSDITVQTVSGSNPWFGQGPSTCNSKGEIISAMIQLNDGTYPYGGEQKDIVWTDGNENVGGSGSTWYCDVQNCVTHELGHNLGIAHHSTGNGEPTMATREQCPSFNTTLKRRTLETDDWAALNFLYQNAFVPSEYSTISSAFNMINQIGEGDIIVSSGTYTESNNLTVNSGVTLQLNLGVTLRMASGKKLTVYGILNAQGTSAQLITFGGINSSPGGWSGIEIKNYGADAYLEYCDIKHAQNGVYIYNTDFVDINYCTIHDNSQCGIKTYNSEWSCFHGNTIYNNGLAGLYCSHYSCGDVVFSDFYNNGTYEVYIETNSNPGFMLFGSYEGENTIICDDYSGNPYYSNSDWAIYHGPNDWQVIEAEGNYWGGNPDAARYGLFNQPDYVDYENWLEKKCVDPALALFKESRELFYQKRIEASMAKLRQIITEYPSSNLTPLALRFLFYIVTKNNGDLLSLQKEFDGYLSGKTAFSEKASYMAETLSIRALWQLGQTEEAVRRCFIFSTVCKDHVFRAHALLNLVYYNLALDLVPQAEAAYQELLSAYAETVEYQLATDMFTFYENGSSPPKPLLPNEEEHEMAMEYRLEPCFPNPFNPETSVSYTLLDERHVRIEVYNILGQKIVTLVDQKMFAGAHTVRWDGRDRLGMRVSAGTYFCLMRAGDFVRTQKMTLLP